MDEECSAADHTPPPESSLDPKELQKFFAYTLLMCKKQRSAPLFGCEASVFHLDRRNNCTWQKLTKGAVPIHIYFDSLRNCYRILSVDGCKPLINCTVVPSINLVKKTAKFCQWLDPRSKICYGLGFESEDQLSLFLNKFQQIQDYSNSLFASSSTLRPDDNMDTPSCSTSATISIECDHSKKPPVECACLSSQISSDASYSLPSEVPGSYETLRYENERLKFALAQSAHNAKRWEQELETLKEKNQRLSQLLQGWIADETKNTNILAENALNSTDKEKGFQLEKLIASDAQVRIQNGEVYEQDSDESELSQKILSVIYRNQELQRRLQDLKHNGQTTEDTSETKVQLRKLHTEVKSKLAEITNAFQKYSEFLETSELI